MTKPSLSVVEAHEGPQARWYVARVAPFMEFKVVDKLLLGGLDAYAPWETVSCANRLRPWLVSVRKFPLISRYVFVALDPAGPRTDLVEDVTGVEGMLRAPSGDLCAIIGNELDRIRWHQIRGLYDHTTGHNATAKRKAKKALRSAVDEARRPARGPRPEHPFGETYAVVSKQVA